MRQILKDGAKAMGMNLSERQLEQLQLYYELLVKGNERMNLTAITEPEEVARRHFLDSMAGAAVLKAGASVIDVGTGAGFPGLVLQIVREDIRVTLLDALQKRITFLEETVQALGLADKVVCFHGRAEEDAHKPELREQFDVAVARAVAPLPVLLEYCGGFVKVHGLFLAYKGPSLAEEMTEAEGAMRRLQLQHRQSLRAEGLGEGYEHMVAVFEKTGKWGLQYPRKQSKIKQSKLV